MNNKTNTIDNSPLAGTPASSSSYRDSDCTYGGPLSSPHRFIDAKRITPIEIFHYVNERLGFDKQPLSKKLMETDPWLFSFPFTWLESSTKTVSRPPVNKFISDVYELGDIYHISINVPGVPIEKIKVDIIPGDAYNTYAIKVKTESLYEKLLLEPKFTVRERQLGSIEQTFALPSSADIDKARVTLKDGVLSIAVDLTREHKLESKTLTVKNYNISL